MYFAIKIHACDHIRTHVQSKAHTHLIYEYVYTYMHTHTHTHVDIHEQIMFERACVWGWVFGCVGVSSDSNLLLEFHALVEPVVNSVILVTIGLYTSTLLLVECVRNATIM